MSDFDTDIADINSTRNFASRIRGVLGLMNEDELAAVLRLESTGTLATWRSQGKGPPSVKLGKRVFYTVPDLGTWIVEEAKKQHDVASQPELKQAA